MTGYEIAILTIIAVFGVFSLVLNIIDVLRKRKVNKSHEPEDEDIGRTE